MPAKERVREYAWPIAAVALLVLVLLVASAAGLAGRRLPAKAERIEVSNARGAYTALAEAGIRGATVVLFDGSSAVVNRVYLRPPVPGAADGADNVGQANVLSELLGSGIARGAYVAMPRAEFDAIAPRLAETWDAIPAGEGYRRRLYGAPVTLVPADSLPQPSEKAVVYIVGSKTGAYDPALLTAWQDPTRAAAVIVEADR